MKILEKAVAAKQAAVSSKEGNLLPRHQRHGERSSWQVLSATVKGSPAFRWQLSRRGSSRDN